MRQLLSDVPEVLPQFRYPIQSQRDTNGSITHKKSIQSLPTKTLTSINVNTPHDKVQSGLRHLEAQAQKINQLSVELEKALWELKNIATQVNQDSRFLSIQPSKMKPLAICEYHSANVSVIKQKSNGCLVLTSRPVDLFKAEREATLLAKQLRQRTKRKKRS